MNMAQTAAGPVGSDERIAFLDILRGFAVMAIFVVNIKAMVMPFAWYSNPTLWATETEQLIAMVQRFVVDDKWRTTFTALYGAGLLMIFDRMAAKGAGIGRLATRNLWLAAFGAIHLLLIWMGDILFVYGVTGLLAMLFVRMGTGKLFTFGLVMLVLGMLWMAFFAAGPAFDDDLYAKLAPMFWEPTEASLQQESDAMLGSVGDQIMSRVVAAPMFILFYFLIGGMWLMTLGLMVTGMGLFRAGLYRGAWPLVATLPLALVFLCAAWGLDAYQVFQLEAADYDFAKYSLLNGVAMTDGVLGAFGYACLISALVSMGLKFGPVAAVGRMAFTNYITCSLIGTTLAGGHGFRLFGEMDLVSITFVTFATFLAMLIWSPLWLRFFRFGPLEWVWRSLVYGKVQPLRR